MKNWNMNSECTKNLKIEIGNRNSKIWKTIKLKSNERQSGMGVEHRKKRKIQTCVSVAVFPMFFDYFWIRSQILPFVFNLIICPSSICCPLLYFLFLISFRFSNLFCFLFSILRQNISLLRWRADKVNLLIKNSPPWTETGFSNLDDARWVELGLIREVGLKTTKNT